MRDENLLISSGVAQSAHRSMEFRNQADRGLINFLREQIASAEWTIAQARAEIAAYEDAIAALERRSPVASQ